MILEASTLSAIFSSLTLVYQAYTSVKSNKERCKQLVDRCALIVERLKPILAADHDAPIKYRVKDLDNAFTLTAKTIRKVGEQSYVVSLLRTEENVALIEDAQRALTELITVLSLETLIDVSAWQRENEVAVRKEFQHVKSAIKRLDESVHSELAGHGATLDQLSQVVQGMAERVGEPLSPGTVPIVGHTPEISSPEGHYRGRSWSSPVGVRPSIASLIDKALPSSETPPGNAASRGRDRMSRSDRLRPPPLSASASYRNEARQKIRQQVHSPVFASSPLAQSHLSNRVPQTASSLPDVFDEIEIDQEVPETPPPPYSALSWEDELAAAYERIGNVPAAPHRSANSRSSTQAVRGSDTPPAATPASPGVFEFQKPLPEDGLLRVRQSLKRKEINNFALMKTIGRFGNINTRVLVEMWLFPKNRTFDTAVPLDSFDTVQRDKLQLIKSRSQQNQEGASPVQGTVAARSEYNHVLLLCPCEARPTVIITETKQALPQQVVKAYILDAVEQMTLVSVRLPDKKFWLLIPYYPEMTVSKAKQCIQRHFGNVTVISCSSPGQSSQLNDNTTLSRNGVQAYDHNLSMRIAPV